MDVVDRKLRCVAVALDIQFKSQLITDIKIQLVLAVYPFTNGCVVFEWCTEAVNEFVNKSSASPTHVPVSIEQESYVGHGRPTRRWHSMTTRAPRSRGHSSGRVSTEDFSRLLNILCQLYARNQIRSYSMVRIRLQLSSCHSSYSSRKRLETLLSLSRLAAISHKLSKI